MRNNGEGSFGSNRLLLNDTRFVTSVLIYQANLKLLLELPIYQLLKNCLQNLTAFVRTSLGDAEMPLFGRSKGTMSWSYYQ